MSKQTMPDEEKNPRVAKAAKKSQAKKPDSEHRPADPINTLQHQAGNRAVQRLLAQRSGNSPFELQDETADRINRERSSGQPLDEGAREHLEGAMRQDFSGVRVHTSPEADTLSQELGARAFTTGQDIFFREGEYQPHSDSGRELIAHEATHVVQQGSGAMGGVNRMTVNVPGDAFEHEADQVAGQVMRATEEDKQVQMQELEDEEEQVQ